MQHTYDKLVDPEQENMCILNNEDYRELPGKQKSGGKGGTDMSDTKRYPTRMHEVLGVVTLHPKLISMTY